MRATAAADKHLVENRPVFTPSLCGPRGRLRDYVCRISRAARRRNSTCARRRAALTSFSVGNDAGWPPADTRRSVIVSRRGGRPHSRRHHAPRTRPHSAATNTAPSTLDQHVTYRHATSAACRGVRRLQGHQPRRKCSQGKGTQLGGWRTCSVIAAQCERG